jgi:anti-anti-sigma factor
VTVWDSPHPDHLQILWTNVGAVPVLSAEGELDSSTASGTAWSTAVARACAHESGEVVVLDLQRLFFMDLVGLASIEQLAGTLKACGRHLVLAGARPRIREFLRNASMTISAGCLSLEEAVAAAATPSASAVTAA